MARSNRQTQSAPLAAAVLIWLHLSAPANVAAAAGVQRHRLENGLRVLLYPSEATDQVALTVLYAIGEDHDPESHLIPLIIQAAMGKREDIKIFGTDYPTPDGTCIRDYIHIEDLCSAHLLALEKLDDEGELIYNLGNGKGYSVREVIESVKTVSGKDFKVTESGRRPGDSPILNSDATKAKSELGWKPKFPELAAIVETAWKWHSENPNGYEG